MVSSEMELVMARPSESERVIPPDVGTQAHWKGERQAEQRDVTEVDGWNRGNFAGQKMRMREIWKVGEGEVPHIDSSGMGAREHIRNFASFASRDILGIVDASRVGRFARSSDTIGNSRY